MARDKVGIRGIWYCGTAAHWRQQMEGVLRAHHGSLSAHAAVHVRTLGSGDAADDLRDTLDSAGFNVLDAGCPAGTAPGENCLLAVKREACCAGGIKAFYDRIRLD
ncbi:hypothetical protein [Streptomyces chartreusis]|uniref:hypothetical protein n=1 Tax=Streptomyces chartreusis TaxID=1969 RepID=UPI0033A15DBF